MQLFDTDIPDKDLEERHFRLRLQNDVEIPSKEIFDSYLPRPYIEGQSDIIDCYNYTWSVAYQNIYSPKEENGFASSYIDTAFNDCIFLWDSAFMSIFGRYCHVAMPLIRTLDNFYVKQHNDGFICRQIRRADGVDAFDKHDHSSTGPNILPWVELKHFLNFGDRDRLEAVFPALLSYHRWLSRFRAWKDGSYWSTGWACGMDNQPRQRGIVNADPHFSHGFLGWCDITLQQLLSAHALIRISEEINSDIDLSDLMRECDSLTKLVKGEMWDSSTHFFFDIDRNGVRTDVMSIGAYWGLQLDLLNAGEIEHFVAHLKPGGCFDSLYPIPSLATRDAMFSSSGNYWCGGVWSPTNYMVLDGLRNHGQMELAHDIAKRHVQQVTAVYSNTGTVWENYSPENCTPGDPAKPDFVGWTGLSSIAILIEHYLGLQIDEPNRSIFWHVNLLCSHGIDNLHMSDGSIFSIRLKSRNSTDQVPEVEYCTKSDYAVFLVINNQHYPVENS
jgi:hypothetical protein